VLAVVKTRPAAGIELLDRPEPAITRPDDVLLRVAACGICGSDLQYYQWHDHLADEITLPRILGHEVAGTVIEVGDAVTEFVPGDRVVSESWARCGRCQPCRLGHANLCEQLLRIGHTIDGGMAPLIVVPEISLYPIPDSLSFGEAATLKPLGVALHSFERAGFAPGDTVAVVGPGTIGLLSCLVAKAAGAGGIALIGLARDARRLALAREFGFATVDASQTDPVTAVREMTGGRGAHLVIEASGGPATLDLAAALARPGGGVSLVGLAAPGQVHTKELVMKELTIWGSLTRLPSTWYRAIALAASGAVDLAPLITHRLPLEQVEDGFQLLMDRSAIKVILEPGS
jgi:threonine dehydrogenase-like Zn-dependent dehydrogenase